MLALWLPLQATAKTASKRHTHLALDSAMPHCTQSSISALMAMAPVTTALYY